MPSLPFVTVSGVGRPLITQAMRNARVPEEQRVQLLVMLSRRNEARAYAESAELDLYRAVADAVDHGASYRDVAATLGLPHQSVHGWLRRHADSIAPIS